MLEVVINGRYGWAPFSELTQVTIEAPADLRDMVWAPAQLTLLNGGGTTVEQGTPFDLPHPGQGAYFQEAVANGCPTSDLTCIRNFIFDNHDGDPGVVRGPNDSNGNR